MAARWARARWAAKTVEVVTTVTNRTRTGGEEAGDARVTAAPAAEVLEGGDWGGRGRGGRRGSGRGRRPARRRRGSGGGGSFWRHFRQIVSRSRGILGRSRVGGTGSWVQTCSIVSDGVVPRKGGRPVSSS